MKTKNLVVLSLLVGIGAALHTITPPIFLGMKPDLMLLMMFLGIMLFPESKNVLLLGAVTGIISGLTTAFPGGLLPNIIDKFFTAFIFYGLFLAVRKLGKPLVLSVILTVGGTIVSGMIFLTSAYYIVGLPGPFLGLVGAVVLPTTLLSGVAMSIIYPIAVGVLKRSNLAISQ